MATPTRSPSHLAHVRSLPCCLRSCGGCSGPVEAHHAFHGATGGGLSMKGSDLAAVPLCHLHHQRLHSQSVPTEWHLVIAAAAIRGAVDYAACETVCNAMTTKALRLALGRAVGEVVDAVDELTIGGR